MLKKLFISGPLANNFDRYQIEILDLLNFQKIHTFVRQVKVFKLLIQNW